MKYIILWALMNIHTGDLEGPFPSKPYIEYTAKECTKILTSLPIQKPDKNENIRIYQCVSSHEMKHQPMQYTDII